MMLKKTMKTHYTAHLLDLRFGNYFLHDLFLTLVFFCSLISYVKRLINYYLNYQLLTSSV